MSFLKRLFEPPETKSYRRSAEAAAQLRALAARDATIETKLIWDAYQRALAQRKRICEVGDDELSSAYGKLVVDIEELSERTNSFLSDWTEEIAKREWHVKCVPCAASYKALMELEIEARSIFADMKDQSKALLDRYNALLGLAAPLLRSRGIDIWDCT